MKLRCIIFAASLFFTATVTAQSSSGIANPTSIQSFQKAFEQYISTEVAPDTPGLAVTVVIGGKPILTKGYGVRKRGGKEKVNTNTAFRLASVSKTFASAAAGTLVQDGKLQWDNKVTNHLVNVNFKNQDYKRKLTLRHLLSHTTGLMPHTYTNMLEDNVSYERILKKVAKVDFICPPGKCYGYQNIVYSLSGDIIETVSDNSFENVVQDNIFSPLKMSDSSYGLKAFKSNKNRATPHIWSRKRKNWIPIRVKKSYYKVPPAAGVNSSINDMQQYLMAQLGHYENVLSKTTLETMHSKQIKTTQRQAHYRRKLWKNLDGVYYGLGWRLFDFKDQKNFVHHGGWVQGARAEMVFNPELQMGMVFLTNSETKRANEVVPTFLKYYKKYIKTEKNKIAALAQHSTEKPLN